MPKPNSRHMWEGGQRWSSLGATLANVFWDFPGGPVVKTLRFHCKRMGLIPGQGTKMAKKKILLGFSLKGSSLK